jgi:hypothetical protein
MNRVRVMDRFLIMETLAEMVKMQERVKVDPETFIKSLYNYRTFLISGGYLYRREQFDNMLNKVYEEAGH